MAAEGLANACASVIRNPMPAVLDTAVSIDLTVPEDWQVLLNKLD